MIINGEIIAAGILKKVKKSIADFKKQGLCPKLTVVMVGDDKPSLSFIKKRKKSQRKLV